MKRPGPPWSRPLLLVLGWAWAAFIVWASVTPSPPHIDVRQGDKLGHLFSYGVLMFWFAMLYRKTPARLAHAAGFIAMGVALEFVQRMLGYRSFEILDMLADAMGVALGGLAAAALTGALRR